MAGYKHYDLNETKMIPLSYADRIVEGSFECALNEIVEQHPDLCVFEHRYRNDEIGRSAFVPKVLLKVVLYGHYRGIISSRRVAEACRRTRRERETRVTTKPKLFTVQDFLYGEANARCICPARHKLYRSGQNMLFDGYGVASFKAPKMACGGCRLRRQCLRHPDRTPHRQLTNIKHQEGPAPRRRSKRNGAAERLRWKFDTPFGRDIYSRRMGTVEPVFGNLQTKGMRRSHFAVRRK